jgi:hypothetical protein
LAEVSFAFYSTVKEKRGRGKYTECGSRKERNLVWHRNGRNIEEEPGTVECDACILM